MKTEAVHYEGGLVNHYFDANIAFINELHDAQKIVILTDETVFSLHASSFQLFPVIKINGTEANKTQQTVDIIINELLNLNVDKSWMLVAVGGGVITDMGGYVASIFKRGIKLGLVPTTILGMTDAAIGGKNGVNVGQYKNMVGTTYRPQYILFDYNFLQTLPKAEWVNGFAEIIKHACIKDLEMFNTLSKNNIYYYINNINAIANLIEQNVQIKTSVVVNDEFENGERLLLNFGHTFGHAIENLYHLPHGSAISIGMMIACKISEEINGFYSSQKEQVAQLLTQYHLPIKISFDKKAVFDLLVKDKKRSGNYINFVLLNAIGNAAIQKISFEQLADLNEQIL
ncbi:3-dehydroquinate synthase [Ferruginibacter yonginensis]|uniref:3-dehydroquinate synthase n=1 Tax=Ferruginibacter yonginensis TaxID=1310416 RepID=A0ABV8QQB1_9BACT